MKITDATIDKLADLSKLEFEGARKEEMKGDLQKMLDFVSKLEELDTDGVEPLIYMLEEENVLRADDAETPIDHQEALKNAPKKDSDYFRVPKVNVSGK